MHGTLVESVTLLGSAASTMIAMSNTFAPLETGGILIGRVQGGGLLVSEATPPGPKAKHTPVAFRRDGDFSQALLDAAVARSVGVEDYVGEWHSHPISQGPSPRDRDSLARISRNRKYACPHPVMLLSRKEIHGWVLEAYQWRNGRLLSLPLVVDEGASEQRPASSSRQPEATSPSIEGSI